MSDHAADTPVIVGVGICQERLLDPSECVEAAELMARAARIAAADAGAEGLLGEIESVSVPQGLWQYRDPGRLVAERLGCPEAKTAVSDLGVLQLTLVNELCGAIARGEQRVGLVVGGEAKFRELRAMITGTSVTETAQSEDTPPADVRYSSSDPFCTDLEAECGLRSPVEFFAIIESALRHARGLGIEEHRDAVARLYSSFADIAAANPNAWKREPVPAENIRDASAKNQMLAFPYTKLHSTSWNVNRAAAILVCSAARATEAGLDPRRWIFPLSAAESKHVVPLARQRSLHSHPGTVRTGERARSLAGVASTDVTAAELYSCFPAAIQSFARDLELSADCAPTVTGSMTFAGGPFNHASIEGVARMVEVLREQDSAHATDRHVGVVSNLSGIFGKQACALFSGAPNESGYVCDDITAEVAEEDVPVPMDEDYLGPVTVVGYTVVFDKEGPTHAIAICDTPDGARTVGRSEDAELLAAMMREEHCGRTVTISSRGIFAA